MAKAIKKRAIAAAAEAERLLAEARLETAEALSRAFRHPRFDTIDAAEIVGAAINALSADEAARAKLAVLGRPYLRRRRAQISASTSPDAGAGDPPDPMGEHERP